MNVIQTGGLIPPRAPMSAQEIMRPQGSGNAGAVAAVIAAVGPEPMVARFVAGSIRSLAELTGGMASVYDYADKSLSKIAQATSSGYLLGYYPSNTAFDGRFRRVTVKVRKPGATVLYRHGYLADPPKTPLDRRQSITYSRIASAVNFGGSLNDVPFRLNTSTAKGANRVPDFVAEITLDPSRVTFSEANGVRAAELDVSVSAAGTRVAIQQAIRGGISIRSPRRVGSAQRAVTMTLKVPVKALVKTVKSSSATSRRIGWVPQPRSSVDDAGILGASRQMTRRDFLAPLGAGKIFTTAALAATSHRRKPGCRSPAAPLRPATPLVRHADHRDIPASRARHRPRIAEALGLKIQIGEHVMNRYGSLGGPTRTGQPTSTGSSAIGDVAAVMIPTRAAVAHECCRISTSTSSAGIRKSSWAIPTSRRC